MTTIKQHGAESRFDKWCEHQFELLESTPLSPDEMTAAIARLKRGAAHYPPTSADLIQVLAQYERDAARLKAAVKSVFEITTIQDTLLELAYPVAPVAPYFIEASRGAQTLCAIVGCVEMPEIDASGAIGADGDNEL